MAPRLEIDEPLVAGLADVDPLHWSNRRITDDLTDRLQPSDHGARTLVEAAGCSFDGARFVGVDLDGVRIRDCEFIRCDLSGTVMQSATLLRVRFVDCRLSGVYWNSSSLTDVSVEHGKAERLSLRMATLERVRFDNVPMPGADCYGAKVACSRWLDCDLTDLDVSEWKLDDVALHGSRLDGLRGVEHLRGATVDHAQAHDIAAALLETHRITVTDMRE